MKKLDFNQMEEVEGGSGCSNASLLLIGASILSAAAFTAATMGAGGVVGIAIATTVLSECETGWLSDIFN